MPTKLRIAILAAFVLGGWAFADHLAYQKARRLWEHVERVERSGRSEPGFRIEHDGGGADVVAATGVQADVCNAFTGGLWFSFLLPQFSKAKDLHPDVRAALGFCARTAPNTLLFRFASD